MKKYLKILTFSWLLVIFLSLLWNYHFIFDLLSHFYLQYLILWVLILIISVLYKDKISIFWAIIWILFLSSEVYNSQVFLKKPPKKADIFYINAFYYNEKETNQIIGEIKKYNPEILAIVELNKKLHKDILSRLNFKDYFYHEEWVLSFWIYSKKDIQNKENIQLDYPLWKAKIGDIEIFLIHPLPPLTKDFYDKQKSFFAEVKEEFDKSKNDKKIIIWDLNSSVYSRVFQQYFWDLYYSVIYSRGRWSVLSIPIDYAMSDKHFFDVYWINSDYSDHIPLIINEKSLQK